MIIGMDFGTTNSGLAYYDGQKLHPIPLDPSTPHRVIDRTALYVTHAHTIATGQQAIDRYLAHNVGRPVKMERVRVGDRYVLERMLETGARVGGEQSGHVIFLDHATTGDGLVTAIQLVNILLESGRRLDELAAAFPRYPQVLLNVRVTAPERWVEDPEIVEAIAQAERRMNDRGRVLVRASGTEPVVRVMTECEDARAAEDVAHRLADLIGRRLNGTVARAGGPPSGGPA